MASEEMHGFDPEVVHRYFDGDLSPSEHDEAEALLAGSAEARALLEQMSRSRSLLCAAAGEWEDELSAGQSDDLFARITSAIDAAAEPSASEAPSAPVGADDAEARPALKVIRGGRRRAFAGLGVVFAAAAAITLAVVGGPGRPAELANGGGPVASRAGSEVIAVDFGQNTGTLFNVEGQAGQPLAVVWISDQVVTP
jgi:anti-sigma factor RsiW